MKGTHDCFPVACNRRKPFASLAIFDTEATGLKRRTRITELCMFAVLTDDLQSTTRPIPRVINKLRLCFNPESAILAEASRLTGLYNDVLEQMSTLKDQAPLITGFLASLPQPVCIIAHNGHRFDFPLLQTEFHKANHPLPAGVEIYCADSLEAFRVLDGLPAIPEWVVRREREEEQRKTLARAQAITSTEKINSNSVVVAPSTTSDCVQGKDRSSEAESKTVSPTKRQLNCTDNSDDSETASKQSKTESTPTSGSQSSVTDSDLAAAYDAAIDQANADDGIDGCVSPVAVLVDGSLQSQQETTPVKDPSWTNTGSVPGQVVKRPPPVSVSSSQAAPVVRRLFDDEPVTSKVESFQGALRNGSFQKNILDRDHTAEDTATSEVISSQGSLPDEKIVQVVEQAELEAVTSLPSSQCGAGDPMLMSQDKVARSVINQCIIPSGDPKSHFLEDQGKEVSTKSINAPIKSQIPLETGWDLSKSSTQSQVSEATSSSSSAAQTLDKAPPSACPPSNTAPKQSYRLGEIYKRQFGRYPDAAHTAEDDCLALLKIILSKRSEFLAFVEDHAVRFDGVKLMY